MHRRFFDLSVLAVLAFVWAPSFIWAMEPAFLVVAGAEPTSSATSTATSSATSSAAASSTSSAGATVTSTTGVIVTSAVTSTAGAIATTDASSGGADSYQVEAFAEYAVSSPMSIETAYALARAKAWLTAVQRAAAGLPRRYGILMRAVDVEDRQALAAQLYVADVEPPLPPEGPVPTAAAALRVTVTLRPKSGEEPAKALRNTALLELRQSILAETRVEVAAAEPELQSGRQFEQQGKRRLALIAGRLTALWTVHGLAQLTPEGLLADPQDLAALEKAARLYPQSVAVLLLLAEAQLQWGLPQQSIATAAKVLRVRPGLPRARYIRALGQWRLHQPALAEDDLNAALKTLSLSTAQNAERARYLRARGAVRLLRQDYAGMCEDFIEGCGLGDCEGLNVARQQNYCRSLPSRGFADTGANADAVPTKPTTSATGAANATGSPSVSPGASSGANTGTNVDSEATSVPASTPPTLPPGFLIRPPGPIRGPLDDFIVVPPHNAKPSTSPAQAQ